MSFPHATPDPSLRLDENDLLVTVIALSAGALFLNGLVFIGAVTVVSRVVRWLKS